MYKANSIKFLIINHVNVMIIHTNQWHTFVQAHLKRSSHNFVPVNNRPILLSSKYCLVSLKDCTSLTTQKYLLDFECALYFSGAGSPK